MQSEREAPRFSLLGSVGVFVGLAGVACALTLLYLSMRSVMDIGGSCASGNQPFVVSHPCPSGVALLFPASIWGGLIFAGIYVWQSAKHHVPSLLWLFWPALFLSLGWNFLYYGLHPPGGIGGVSGGWLVCAVLFGLMGGIPLLFALPATIRRFTGAPSRRKPLAVPATNTPLSPTWNVFSGVRQTSPAPNAAPQSTPGTWWPGVTSSIPGTSPPAASSPSMDVVAELERLAALYRSGALSDTEFNAAKARILGTGR